MLALGRPRRHRCTDRGRQHCQRSPEHRHHRHGPTHWLPLRSTFACPPPRFAPDRPMPRPPTCITSTSIEQAPAGFHRGQPGSRTGRADPGRRRRRRLAGHHHGPSGAWPNLHHADGRRWPAARGHGVDGRSRRGLAVLLGRCRWFHDVVRNRSGSQPGDVVTVMGSTPTSANVSVKADGSSHARRVGRLDTGGHAGGQRRWPVGRDLQSRIIGQRTGQCGQRRRHARRRRSRHRQHRGSACTSRPTPRVRSGSTGSAPTDRPRPSASSSATPSLRSTASPSPVSTT